MAARRPAPAPRHRERASSRSASITRVYTRRLTVARHRRWRSLIGGGFAHHPDLGLSDALRRADAMTLDSEDSRRPARREVGPPPFEIEAGQPGQPAQVHRHRRRHRPRRRLGGGVARRARLQRPELLHPRQPAPRAQHRRAGRHQRREELPERRRQHPAAVLRHDQGRRLPRARGQRLPAGAAERQHHRPVRRAGRAVRARVRRPARQPLVRRRAGLAHVLRARPDRPAAAARRLPVDDAAGRQGHGRRCSRNREMLDLVVVDGQARGIICRNLLTGEIERYAGARRAALHRRLRHGLLPVDQRGELERHRGVARAQARRLLRQSLLHADPPDLHPGLGRRTSRS